MAPSCGVFVIVLLAAAPVSSVGAQGDAPRAEADGALEEIVVTAQKRREASLAVPISLVALSGDELEAANLTRLEDLQAYVPNLVMTETPIGSNVFVRGIGSGVNQGFEQSVGTYVDGVYRGRARQSRIPLFDVERVEVLRGTQSILFGKNSIAGALNIETAAPTRERDFRALFRYEPAFDERRGTLVLSGPIGDRWSGRLALLARDTAGYVENLTLGRDEPAREDRYLRATVRWAPSDQLAVTLKAETGRFDVVGRQTEVVGDRPAQGGPFAGLTYAEILQAFGQGPSVANNTLDFRRSANGDSSDNATEEVVLTADLRFDAFDLTSITAWSAYDYEELCDCDFTGGNVFGALFAEDFDQFSQELRFTSPRGRSLEWIAGAFYQTHDLRFFDTLLVDGASVLVSVVDALAGPGAGGLIANTGTPRTLVQDDETLAAFGQLTWNASERLAVTLGGRLTRNEKHARRRLTVTAIDGTPLPPVIEPATRGLYAALFNVTNHDLSGGRVETDFLPSLDVEYRMTPTTLAYVSFAHGVKNGGFDARSNNAPEDGGSFEFDDEEADSVELGTKLSLADGAAELSVALFHTEFDQLQVSAFDGVLGFNVGNAARAVTRGLEFESRWRPTPNLLLDASLAFTDFEFEDYFGQCFFGLPPDAPDGVNCSYAGRTNQLIGDWSAVVGADLRVPLAGGYESRLGVDVIASDDYLVSPNLDPRLVQEGFTRIDARVTLVSPDAHWTVSLVGRNLTDEAILTFGNDVPLAGSNFGAPGFYGLAEPPRSVALQASLRF